MKCGNEFSWVFSCWLEFEKTFFFVLFGGLTEKFFLCFLLIPFFLCGGRPAFFSLLLSSLLFFCFPHWFNFSTLILGFFFSFVFVLWNIFAWRNLAWEMIRVWEWARETNMGGETRLGGVRKRSIDIKCPWEMGGVLLYLFLFPRPLPLPTLCFFFELVRGDS